MTRKPHTDTRYADDIEDTGHVRFKLGKWEIHQLAEDDEWVNAFHHCQKRNPVKDRVEYAYQVLGDNHCPGCNAVQPDEIQGMVAMFNMDQPARVWGRTVMKQMDEDHTRIFMEQWKAMSVKDPFK